jgi:regulator of replication initiation timing
MSRRSVKIEEENAKLRQELKKLKNDLKHSKQHLQYFSVFSQEEKKKLILKTQEKLEQGIFSPPKRPGNPKSPVNKLSTKRSPTPDFKSKNQKTQKNKENLIEYNTEENPILLENYGKSFISDTFSNTYLEPYPDLSDTAQCTIDTFQTLERENKLLKELNSLRVENQKLRSKLTQKPLRKLSCEPSINKSYKATKSRENSLTGYPNCSESFYRPVSPKPCLKTSCQSTVNRHNRTKSFDRKSKKHSFAEMNKSSKLNTPTQTPSKKNHNKAFSDIFSCTAPGKKSRSSLNSISNNKTTTPDYLLLKSPKSSIQRQRSSSTTPKSKPCPNCSNLLSKSFLQKTGKNF